MVNIDFIVKVAHGYVMPRVAWLGGSYTGLHSRCGSWQADNRAGRWSDRVGQGSWGRIWAMHNLSYWGNFALSFLLS